MQRSISTHRCPCSRLPGCLGAAVPSPSEPPRLLRTRRRRSLRVLPRPALPETSTKTRAHLPPWLSLPSLPFVHGGASPSHNGTLRGTVDVDEPVKQRVAELSYWQQMSTELSSPCYCFRKSYGCLLGLTPCVRIGLHACRIQVLPPIPCHEHRAEPLNRLYLFRIYGKTMVTWAFVFALIYVIMRRPMLMT